MALVNVAAIELKVLYCFENPNHNSGIQ